MMTVTVPDTIADVLRMPPENAASELLMLAAVKLFEMGRMSSGAASELAGVPKPLFLQRLGDYGICVSGITEDELQRRAGLSD